MLYDDSIMDSYPVLTPEDMRRTEQKAFSLGVSSLLLMEHAALAVVDELEKLLGGSCAEKRVLFLCGTGNNGGDGLAAARLFSMRGGQPTVWLYGEPKTQDAQTNLQWLRLLPFVEILNLGEMAEEELPFDGESPNQPFDGYVDALLGTGFRGRIDSPLLARMALAPYHDFHLGIAHMPPVIAVDIPSGVNGKTGEAEWPYVHADVTVTFNAPKPGLYLTKDREAVGKIVVADIGLWDMMPWNSDLLLLDDPELRCETLAPSALRFLTRRAVNAHKGHNGRVLIYAGKMGMAGAAAMCAQAAVTAGAGLTTVACEQGIMPILQTLVPNAMCMEIGEAVKNPPAHDVLALGCGLGQSEEVWQNILKLWNPEKPSVWDADALNLLAKHPMRLGKNAVIIPHPGEAARLLGKTAEEILADRFAAAQALAKQYDCTAALKSDVTVICKIDEDGPEFRLNTVGSPALAKGGSGDALTGILASLLWDYDEETRSPLPFSIHNVALACLWHGAAGLVGEKKYGQRELTTGQLIACLHEAERMGRGECDIRP
ncbi:MAG: NAD(P)H-hydrate dehydratase [Clostridia bacterium]|nr:NAD(P)H-hydrate dehydratase [Clostridia bacterium]